MFIIDQIREMWYNYRLSKEQVSTIPALGPKAYVWGLCRGLLKPMNTIQKKLLSTSLNIIEKSLLAAVAVMVLWTSVVPQAAYAAETPKVMEDQWIGSAITDRLTLRFMEAEKQLVKIPEPTVKIAKTPVAKGEFYVTTTAYSSDVAQTDSTPCLTADGYNVCKAGVENIIAANFLPIGTQVMIPDAFGDRIFTVHDRMNKRYTNRVDIWMTSRQRALNWGVRTVKVVVVE